MSINDIFDPLGIKKDSGERVREIIEKQSLFLEEFRLKQKLEEEKRHTEKLSTESYRCEINARAMYNSASSEFHPGRRRDALNAAYFEEEKAKRLNDSWWDQKQREDEVLSEYTSLVTKKLGL